MDYFSEFDDLTLEERRSLTNFRVAGFVIETRSLIGPAGLENGNLIDMDLLNMSIWKIATILSNHNTKMCCEQDHPYFYRKTVRVGMIPVQQFEPFGAKKAEMIRLKLCRNKYSEEKISEGLVSVEKGKVPEMINIRDNLRVLCLNGGHCRVQVLFLPRLRTCRCRLH